MIEELIPFLFVISIAFFKSIADTLQHHFSISIFGRFKGNKFIDPSESNAFKKSLSALSRLLTGSFIDLWHISNSAMLMSAFIGIIYTTGVWFSWVTLLFMWLCYFVVFEFFYGFWLCFPPKK